MPEQPDIVITEPLRTPIGRFGGLLAGQRRVGLAALVISEVVRRTGIDPGQIDEVILGHAYPTSDAPAIGRVAALDAGLPDSVTGVQTDRRCGSGLQAVLDAAMQIRCGFSDVVIAGGVDVMSAAPSTRIRAGGESRDRRSSSTTPSPAAVSQPEESTTPFQAA